LPDFWEFGAYKTVDPQKLTPPTTYAPVQEEKDQELSATGAGIVGGLAGLAIGAAGAAVIRRRSQSEAEAAESAATEAE
jgi:hypothetical protein